MQQRRLEKFYIVSPPELVDETEKELEEVWPFLLDETGRPIQEEISSLQKTVGGIEFEARLIQGLQLNRLLKTASRILLRKTTFKARELYQVEGQLKSCPWKIWVPEGKKLRFSIAASESKTNNEKKIFEMLNKILSKTFPIVEEGEDFYFFLRHFQNEMTISLDTSGEHLHRRGDLGHRTEAPLRETLAAAGLRWMTEDVSLGEYSRISWLDPMAGSGTHGAEVLNLNSLSSRQEFSYLSLREVPKLLKSEVFWNQHPLARSPSWASLVLADRESKAVQVMSENFKNKLGVSKILKKDLFESSSLDDYGISSSKNLFVIINPPYGERLGLQSPRNEMKKIFEKAQEVLKPRRLGMWVPQNLSDQKWGLEPAQRILVKNGGIPVNFVIWNRPKTAFSN